MIMNVKLRIGTVLTGWHQMSCLLGNTCVSSAWRRPLIVVPLWQHPRPYWLSWMSQTRWKTKFIEQSSMREVSHSYAWLCDLLNTPEDSQPTVYIKRYFTWDLYLYTFNPKKLKLARITGTLLEYQTAPESLLVLSIFEWLKLLCNKLSAQLVQIHSSHFYIRKGS